MDVEACHSCLLLCTSSNGRWSKCLHCYDIHGLLLFCTAIETWMAHKVNQSENEILLTWGLIFVIHIPPKNSFWFHRWRGSLDGLLHVFLVQWDSCAPYALQNWKTFGKFVLFCGFHRISFVRFVPPMDFQPLSTFVFLSVHELLNLHTANNDWFWRCP